MSKDAFWNLIAEAKKECGQDLGRTTQWIEDRLVTLGPQQARDFDSILHGYIRLGDQYGLQSAASIMWECDTDDGFYNFLPWLIVQGKDVYLTALKDPDSLADIEPYGGCEFESLTCAGTHALTAMPGPRQHISALYDGVPPELEEDIVYGEGIGYPYEWNELQKYVPRLCARYLPSDKLDAQEREPIWNLDNDEIQAARAAGPQSAPVRRLALQPVPKAPEASPPHDIEQIITDMRGETIRQIRQDRELPEGQLAWYWGYIGALDMAQKLGLITDERCQALCHEAEGFKPDCVVTARESESQTETVAETKIGDMSL